MKMNPFEGDSGIAGSFDKHLSLEDDGEIFELPVLTRVDSSFNSSRERIGFDSPLNSPKVDKRATFRTMVKPLCSRKLSCAANTAENKSCRALARRQRSSIATLMRQESQSQFQELPKELDLRSIIIEKKEVARRESERMPSPLCCWDKDAYQFEDSCDDASEFDIEGSEEFDPSLFDVAEQERLWDSFNSSCTTVFSADHAEGEATTEETQETTAAANASCRTKVTNEKGQEMIAITSELSLPLRTSKETFEAIMDGRVTVTCCSACGNELTCIEDAGLVLCSDCWVFSPVSDDAFDSLEDPKQQTIGGGLSPQRKSIGIGVKADEILEWLPQSELDSLE